MNEYIKQLEQQNEELKSRLALEEGANVKMKRKLDKFIPEWYIFSRNSLTARYEYKSRLLGGTLASVYCSEEVDDRGVRGKWNVDWTQNIAKNIDGLNSSEDAMKHVDAVYEKMCND